MVDIVILPAPYVDDVAILSYCAGDSKIGGLNSLQMTLIKIDWFYK